MEWVEITGRTVKEATELALDELGVDESDAEVQVLEEPRAGLFGRTKGAARVKARVIPRQHRPKQERRDRKRSGGGRNRGKGGSTAPATADGTRTGSESTSRPARDEGSASEGGGGRRRRRSGSGAGAASGDAPRRSDRPSAPAAIDGPDGPQQGDTVDTQIMTFDEHVATVEGFVTGLVAAFGLTGTVEIVEVDDETREVRIVGDDLGLLIGPRGLTLQAVHELARTVVFRAAPDGQDGRVRIDIGGYRERRREALERFATSIADTVRDTGEAKAMEPMSAPDRKIVHDTINDIDGVRTSSEGDEPRRRVVVHPAD